MKYLIALATFLATLTNSATQPVAIPPDAQLAPGESGRVAVLIYHHLAPPEERPEEPGVITPERFESHLQMLRAEGYHLASAAEFAAFLDGRLALPARSVLITFDDGYASNYHLGLPLLQKYRAPALIFPVMKYFDTDGKGAYSPHLTREHARAMLESGLVAFGSHTYDGHGKVAAGPDGSEQGPFLTTRKWLAEEGRQESEEEFQARVRADLERSIATLRSIGVQEEALHFALPWGLGAHERADLLRSLGFRYIYTVDDSELNYGGQQGLVHRMDAGDPTVSAEWLKERLEQLFSAPLPAEAVTRH
ncbi:MAG: polysaccharide deacetylase family protein [Bacillota bacterium]